MSGGSLEDGVLNAAAKWAMADAIAHEQPYGTGRNVWEKTAERLAHDVFAAARARHYQAAGSSLPGADDREVSDSRSAVRPVPFGPGATPGRGS